MCTFKELQTFENSDIVKNSQLFLQISKIRSTPEMFQFVSQYKIELQNQETENLAK